MPALHAVGPYALVGVMVCLLASHAWAQVAQVSASGCCATTKTSGRGQTSDCNNVSKASDCENGGIFTLGGKCTSTGTCGVGFKSDPVFTGFDGSTFEFFGTPGSNYTVLTSNSVTVNMGLVEAGPLHIRHQDGQGTFVGSLAMILPSLELIVQVSEAGNMTFTMDSIEVDVATPGTWGAIDYEPFLPDVGQVVTISISPFRFTVVAVKQYTDTASGYNRGHLDLSVEMTGHAGSTVAGVLGQTLYSSTKADEATFEIPSLTFQPGLITEVAFASTRRLLSLDGHFPRHAGLSAGSNMGA